MKLPRVKLLRSICKAYPHFLVYGTHEYLAGYDKSVRNKDASSAPETGTRADLMDLVAALIAIVLLVVDFVDRVDVARVLLALLFTLYVPGRAVMSNWPRMADWSDIGMSIALSLGILILLSTTTLWIGFWHPLGLFHLEAALSLVGLSVATARRHGLLQLSNSRIVGKSEGLPMKKMILATRAFDVHGIHQRAAPIVVYRLWHGPPDNNRCKRTVLQSYSAAAESS
jgi:hypothetical protein